MSIIISETINLNILLISYISVKGTSVTPRYPSRRTHRNTKKTDTTDPTPQNITPDNDVVDNTTQNEKTQGIFVSITAHLLYAMNEFMMFLFLQLTKFYSTDTSPEVDNANADGTLAETTDPTRPNVTPDNDVVANAADNEENQGISISMTSPSLYAMN